MMEETVPLAVMWATRATPSNAQEVGKYLGNIKLGPKHAILSYLPRLLSSFSTHLVAVGFLFCAMMKCRVLHKCQASVPLLNNLPNPNPVFLNQTGGLKIISIVRN